MSPMILRFFTLVGVALAAASIQLKARAAPLPELEAQQVNAVIAQQLKAFADDDAEGAFAVATPKLREAVGDAAKFLALVRGSYPMVYRPASFGFLVPEKDGSQVLQVVSIRDDEGKSWFALFSLEQQPDKSWRIGGCIVAGDSARFI